MVSNLKCKGLLFGFGRMGITHIALFNKYFSENIEWDVFEPSWKTRMMVRFLGSLANVNLVKEKNLDKQYDLAIICSPPQFHDDNYIKIKAHAKKVFVEKPGYVENNEASNIYVGYVLRHSPCIAELKNRISKDIIKKVKVEIRANTVLEQGTGWRSSGKGGGVINEFGSHAINLAKYLVNDEYKVTSLETEQVVSNNCPDICKLKGITESGTEVEIYLNWSDASVRKPAYLVEVILSDGTKVVTDLFQVWDRNNCDESENISGVANWENKCKFYIRGLEFSEQARYFSETTDFSQDLQDSIFTDNILREST